ncbi:hypothetical protein [Solilutibacter silvestris]|uniref:hypothetical protein n=1 Tax=Solilutibacter silvestris TaxID=1645665 RepID=UPI003D344F30
MAKASLPIVILFLIAPLACPAQDIGDSVRSRVACNNTEQQLVSYLVSQRNEGVPVETMIERSNSLPENDGSRYINIGRVEDVYLDKSLTRNTLFAYRSARCLEGTLLQDFKPYQDFTRTELLKCQALGYPSDRKFGNCVYKVVYSLQEKASKR